MIIEGVDFKVGADPEFFLKQSGKLVSAYGLIAGDKKAPQKVKNGAVQVDGMALEFNIDPASDFKEFNKNMSSVLTTLETMVPGYEIFISPVADFGQDYIDSQPDVAKALGCDPDFNAYTGAVNPVPNAAMPFRTASGHIHIGWTEESVDPHDPTHFEACRYLTKWLDLFIGAPSLIWDEGPGDFRRQLYGRAGAFRPKPYGMEYRVLSNLWINDPVRRMMVYYNAMDAIKCCFGHYDVVDTLKFGGTTIPDIINKNVSESDWLAGLFAIHTSEKFPVRAQNFWRKQK